ncbi:MAG: hypothetical protein AVDCRST_MAG55-2059, partial [uncultured Rubrobacteraceae bacterium]
AGKRGGQPLRHRAAFGQRGHGRGVPGRDL